MAFVWQISEVLPTANGVCPRSSAPVEQSGEVCVDHQSKGICEACGQRQAVQFEAECINCIFLQHGPFVLTLPGSTELLGFLTAHDINPTSPSPERFGAGILNQEETVLQTDPMEAEFRFAVEDDRIRVTVDGSPAVVDATTANWSAIRGIRSYQYGTYAKQRSVNRCGVARSAAVGEFSGSASRSDSRPLDSW